MLLRFVGQTVPGRFPGPPHPAAQERHTVDGTNGRSRGPQRGPAKLPPSWSGDLAALDGRPPTKPGRSQNALLQIIGRARHVTRLRPPGRRASDQGSHPEPLHRNRNPAHAAHSIGRARARARRPSDHHPICATEPPDATKTFLRRDSGSRRDSSAIDRTSHRNDCSTLPSPRPENQPTKRPA